MPACDGLLSFRTENFHGSLSTEFIQTRMKRRKTPKDHHHLSRQCKMTHSIAQDWLLTRDRWHGLASR